nr:extracellular solute-binding protein [Nodosilinea sp. FACHB-131]
MPRRQTLTVWSPYADQDVEILIKNYQAVHPDVDIIHTTHGLINYFSFLKKRMAQGLGPDMAIVPDPVLPSMIEQELIEDLEPYQLDTSNFYGKALVSLRAENQHLYGVPFGFEIMALCYNRAQTTDPPTTLNTVLNQASQGKGIAIDAGFLSSVWGISAMSGALFNSIDHFTLEEQPLSRWLSWLKNAQQTPNVYIDSRREVLFDLFAAGNVAYFPCWTFEISALQKKLGNQLSIAVLPGELDSAAPVLETDALVVNAYARADQKRLALEFAMFITRREQQLAFQSVENTFVVPTNPKVLVDRRLLEIQRSLIDQVQNSFPIPIAQAEYRTNRLIHYGDPIYAQVMQGDLSPTEGARQFIDQINQPVSDEVIEKSLSVPSEAEINKLQGNIAQLQGNITPRTDYLLQLGQIQLQTLRRPIIWLQVILCTVVGVLIWWIARRLNRLISTFIQRFND